jgi:hypothetical protein
MNKEEVVDLEILLIIKVLWNLKMGFKERVMHLMISHRAAINIIIDILILEMKLLSIAFYIYFIID